MSQNQLLCTNLDILHLSCGSGGVAKQQQDHHREHRHKNFNHIKTEMATFILALMFQKYEQQCGKLSLRTRKTFYAYHLKTFGSAPLMIFIFSWTCTLVCSELSKCAKC